MCSGSRPSSSQAPRTASRTGIAVFGDHDAQAAIARQFVERSGDAAARRIAHPANAAADGVRQRLHQRKHGARIGAEVRFQIEFAARQQDGDAVIADGAGEQNLVAGPDRRGARGCTPGIGGRCRTVVMYMRSALPCSTTLVSPPAMTTPARRAAAAMARDFGFQDLGRQPGFQDVADHQRLRRAPETARSLTVPFTASSPMEPPGKRKRLHHEAVGGDRDAGAVDVDVGGVAQGLGGQRRRGAARTGLRPGGGWPCRRRRAPSRPAGRGSEFSEWRAVMVTPHDRPTICVSVATPCGARSCSRPRRSLPTTPSARPTGCSGVHSLPNSLHCAGFSTPFRTSPHCAALGSVTRTPGTEKRRSASHCGVSCP